MQNSERAILLYKSRDSTIQVFLIEFWTRRHILDTASGHLLPLVLVESDLLASGPVYE